MLIRENGQRITLLRTTPTRTKGTSSSKARGRAQRHTVVGVFAVADGVPECIRLGLTPAESRALDRWLAAFHASQAQHAVPSGTRATSRPGLDELLTTLEAIAVLVDPEAAQTVRGEVQLVSHALRRGGHAGSCRGQHARHPLLASEISPRSEERPVAASAAARAAPAAAACSAS
ncbi:hypothetical protein [Burkholderia gladioli]|uniref:hypothetical protein n=1 Tax=Burkholderia gladioli TaxID=28095 RepID=UPI00163F401D|nr:hypothetical protein [Burkholderia gladioli]MBU9385768.1 hypothetical protein [Burkholderia gladioli]